MPDATGQPRGLQRRNAVAAVPEHAAQRGGGVPVTTRVPAGGTDEEGLSERGLRTVRLERGHGVEIPRNRP